MTTNQQRLSQILVKLSHIILKTDFTLKLSLVKNLLTRIKEEYFFQLIQKPHSTFVQVMLYLIRYYKQQKYEIITLDYIKNQEEENQFIHLYRLVIDLFLTQKKQEFVEYMIKLQQEDKETLMPFVESIKDRKFIGQKMSIAQQLDQLRNLQFIYLKQAYSNLVQEHEKLKQNYNLLQTENSYIKLQIKAYQSEKFQLLQKMQLGKNVTFQEIAQKYEDNIKEYNDDVSKLESEIQQCRDSLQAKQTEINDLNNTIWHNSEYESKYKQMKYALQQNQSLKKQIQISLKFNMKLRTQLEFIKDKAIKLQEQLKEKVNQLEMNEIQLSKYQKLKKANILFRKKMMKQFNGF